MNKNFYYKLGHDLGKAGGAAPEQRSNSWQEKYMLEGWRVGSLLHKDEENGKVVHVVWIANGIRPPRQVRAILKIHKAVAYCILRNGQRRVVGATAFFTERAAMCRFLGNLDRAAHDIKRIPAIRELMVKYRPPRVYYGKRYFDPQESADGDSQATGR